MQLKVIVAEGSLAEQRLVPETIMDEVQATLVRMGVKATLSLVEEDPVSTGYGLSAAPTKLRAAPFRFDDAATPVGFSIGAAFRDSPDGLLKWLLAGTQRRPLPNAYTAVALAVLGDLLQNKPTAHLVDVYESLHAKPELASFAVDVRAAFIPS